MIRILLADDEHLIRTALAQMLELEDDLTIVAEAAQGDVAIKLAIEHAVDVAVLDLQMPGKDGIAVAEQLAKELPTCRCVIVTSHGRPGHLKRALAAGVRGFLPEDDVGGDARLGGAHRARGRAPRRPRAGRRGDRRRRQPADAARGRRAGAGRERRPDRRDRRPGGALAGHGAQLPVERDDKLNAANRHEAVAVARRMGWI